MEALTGWRTSQTGYYVNFFVDPPRLDHLFAGPETALREFAGGQVKKGVRTIGMGGDGATTGNYALVY
jgi:hypothetical protein